MKRLGGADHPGDRNNRVPLGRLLWIGLAGLALWLLFLPDLGDQFRGAVALEFFEGDVRQHVAPLWRLYDSNLFVDDYVTDYFFTLMPVGYEWLAGWLSRWLTPPEISLQLQFSTFAALLVLGAATAWRLAGVAAAVATVALLISANIFYANIAGGTPRSFGYPLIALVALALVTGRPWVLALTTVLGALVYAPAAIVAGLVLALSELAPGPVARWFGAETRASVRSRWMFVGLVGILSLAFLALPVIEQGRYGGDVDATDPADAAAFPERLGRHPLNIARQASAADMPSAATWFTRAAFVDYKAPKFVPFVWKNLQWRDSPLLLTLAVAMVGIGLGMLAGPPMRRFLLLPLAMVIVVALSVLLYPRLYYPTRYFEYVLPLVLALAVPAGFACLAARLPLLRNRSAWQTAVVLLGTAVLVLGWGSRGSLERGHSVVRVSAEEQGLYAYLATLPKDTLIAGWPAGPTENVPFLTGRPVLVSHEVHHAFYKAYAMTLRERTTDLIAAYLAPAPSTLERLREVHGVTHLVVDAGHFRPDSRATYFAPFDQQANTAYAALAEVSLAAVLRLREQAVYDHGDIFVLELATLNHDAPAAHGVPAEVGGRGN